MAIDAYSSEWAEAFKREINASPKYRAAAEKWEGTVGLVVLAEPDKNVPDDQGIFLDLWHGEAREVRIVSRAEAEQADYAITASYSRWKQVATKQLDPIKGIVLGRLKLRGNFAVLVRYTKASQELTECTTRVPVVWPDDAAG
ncbi:MAG: SCP2 sterol-binding domain-containing protein [Candidatus Dormibacteria bacterium]